MAIAQWQRTFLKQNVKKLGDLGLDDFQEVLNTLVPYLSLDQLRLVHQALEKEELRRG